MASFSKKAGYKIEDAPEYVDPREMYCSGVKKTSDQPSRLRIVRGHDAMPDKRGVRLLITGARREHVGTRGTDMTTFYRTYLTIERANDVLPGDSMKQAAAQPRVGTEICLTHSEIPYHYENSTYAMIENHCVGPDGNFATIDDLVEGKVDCLAFNAPLFRYAPVRRPKGLRAFSSANRGVDMEAEDLATDWQVLVVKDEKGGPFGMSRPKVGADLQKHREVTAKAEQMVSDYLREKEMERGNSLILEDESFDADAPEL